ncbi:MAG: GTPase HflX [Candidatus Latescibacterota bacterium]|nr:MAG: GTPase HflX [Candidatus Latescibacterota bacterium]
MKRKRVVRKSRWRAASPGLDSRQSSRNGGRRRREVDLGVDSQARDRGWQRRRVEERCILVGVVLPPRTRSQEEENLDELERLSRTAGAEPQARLVQERREPNVRTYIGRGKVDELDALCQRLEANLVIFDDTLSPAQARNLEEVLNRNVIDRTELILDIFARHARTREAMLQVELAQLQYMRPRLRRLWDHLSRQDGAIGTRGPGETQLEVDRRRVGERIASLRRSLRERDRIVATQRKARDKAFRVALVGYTNAGKTSLMNALAGSQLLVENQLFSTLDATTRRLELDGGSHVLLTDTVGFIRKLPHDLVASFRTTLSEIGDADLLLHVVDITTPNLAAHIDTVHEVLGEILEMPRDTFVVFNKMDALEDASVVNVMLRHHPRAHFVSARSAEGLTALRRALLAQVRSRTVELEIEILQRASEIFSFCFRAGEVVRQGANPEGRPQLFVRFPDAAFKRFIKTFRGNFTIVDAPAATNAIDPIAADDEEET